MSKKLTAKERIMKFIQKNDAKEVNQNIFPYVLLMWKTGRNKEIAHYYNLKTGAYSHTAPAILSKYPPNNPDNPGSTWKDGWFERKPCFIASRYPRTHVSINGHEYPIYDTNWYLSYPGKDLNAIYVKTDNSLKVMEISVFTMDTSRTRNGARKWTRNSNYSRIFFVEGSKIPYNEYGNRAENFSIMKYFWREGTKKTNVNFKEWAKTISRFIYPDKSAEEFMKFSHDTLSREKGFYLDPTSCYGVYYWLTYNIPLYKESPINRLIDNLNKNIKELSIPDKKLSIQSKSKFLVIQRLTENWLVLRYVTSQWKYNMETYRVFVNKNKVIAARRIKNGKWVRTSFREEYQYYWNENGHYIPIGEEELRKFPFTKNLYDVVTKNFPPEKWVNKLIKFSKAPIFETFFKSEYKNIAHKLEENNKVTGDEEVLRTLFGNIPNKKTNSLFAKCGVNKYQMQKFDEHLANGTYPETRIIKSIKKMMETNYIGDISNKEFDCYFNFVKELLKDYRTRDVIEKASIIPNKKLFWNRVIKISNSTPELTQRTESWGGRFNVTVLSGVIQVCRTVNDVLQLLNNLPENLRPSMRFKWKNHSDIIKAHDELIMLNNTHIKEIEMLKRKEEIEKMRKIDAGRKYLEYEDDNFIIRLPALPSEISLEGRDLHHCVAGYATSHSEGRTTIIFLRRKNAPNKSFYTIEVRNAIKKKDATPSIVQIHGFGNKWLGNNPEAIPFVMRWLLKNKISCTDQILLSTSLGYSGYGAPMIEKPII